MLCINSLEYTDSHATISSHPIPLSSLLLLFSVELQHQTVSLRDGRQVERTASSSDVLPYRRIVLDSRDEPERVSKIAAKYASEEPLLLEITDRDIDGLLPTSPRCRLMIYNLSFAPYQSSVNRPELRIRDPPLDRT